MLIPSQAFKWFLAAWFVILTVLIGYRLLTGQIAVAGVFTTADGRFSGERVQLLTATLAALSWYVDTALVTGKFPDMPDWLFLLFLGSHSLYLAGKFAGR